MCQSTLSSNMSHESRMDDKQFDVSKIAVKLVSLTSAVFDPKNQKIWVCKSSEFLKHQIPTEHAAREKMKLFSHVGHSKHAT